MLVLAAVSDVLDGYIARRGGQVTPTGAALDPITDKLFVLTIAITLVVTGHLSLFEADPKAYKELSRAKVCGETWAHPALVDGRVYLRDDKELVCIPLK